MRSRHRSRARSGKGRPDSVSTATAGGSSSIGVLAVAAAEQAVAITLRHVKQRAAFGKPLMDLQNTRFKLAECKTQAHIGRVFLDSCIERFIAGRLDEASTAMAKYWLTECQCRVIDECVQLHGGYGDMTEYPIARMWPTAACSASMAARTKS